MPEVLEDISPKVRISTLMLMGYLFLCYIFLITIGIDAIEGRIAFDFFADSETYMKLAAENVSPEELVIINANLLGPYILLRGLDSSYHLVFLMNAAIFCYFFFTLSKLYDLNRFFLFGGMVLSPFMVGNIVGINKEILGILVLTMLLIHNRKRKFIYFLLALIFAPLVRWQMCLFVLVFGLMESKINPLREKRGLAIGLLLVLISIVYPLNLDQFESVDSIAQDAMREKQDGGGSYSFFIRIQNSPFGYILVVIPKFLQLLLGPIFRYSKMFNYEDLYNDVLLFFQSIINLFQLALVVKKRISINNVFVFMAIVYSIVFCLTPIFSPRYLFPVYVLLVLALASKKEIA